MFRPKDWENPYKEEYWQGQEKEIFEAGADAYEAAIWKIAEESPTGTFTFDTNVSNIFEVNDES